VSSRAAAAIGKVGGPSYREAKGGDIQPQPFWQARYYDFKLWI
jgi:hypothetical protein